MIVTNFMYCLQFFQDIEILKDEITLPRDRPLCGFYNELCRAQGNIS